VLLGFIATRRGKDLDCRRIASDIWRHVEDICDRLDFACIYFSSLFFVMGPTRETIAIVVFVLAAEENGVKRIFLRLKQRVHKWTDDYYNIEPRLQSDIVVGVVSSE
jgi:hypothetical protein